MSGCPGIPILYSLTGNLSQALSQKVGFFSFEPILRVGFFDKMLAL